MKYNEIRYTYKFNKGNYESEEISASAAVEQEAPEEVISILKALVHGESKPVTMTAAPKVAEIAPSPAPAKPKKTAAPKVEAPVEVPVEAVVEAPAVKAAPAPAKKSRIVKKVEVYSRSNDLHKKLIGEILDLEYPKWRTNPTKAKEASVKLEGVDFLDAEGLILPSFKESFKEMMS